MNKSEIKRRHYDSITYSKAKLLAETVSSRYQLKKADRLIYRKSVEEGWIEDFFPDNIYTHQGQEYRVRFRRWPVESPLEEVRELFRIANKRKLDAQWLSLKSGVNVNTIHNWRANRNMPMLKEFVYVLAALGYKITIEPIEKKP